MQEPDAVETSELCELLDKLNIEADRAIKYINAIREKGIKAIHRADSVMTPSIQRSVREQAKKTVYQSIERLVEINCDLELADDVSPNLAIPYYPVGDNSIELTFYAGDNPWNFCLLDAKVDTKTLHKNLLKKYQNDLLEPYPYPKPSESVCFLDRSKIFRGIVLQTLNHNKVKLVDCDSNVTKVIATDRVFKADPDACHIHTSILRCTISKDSAGEELWNMDLRDVFCNTLKEASLHVKVLERLSGSFPTFLVDVKMTNDDEEFTGNLTEWIITRLIPELKKLSTDENESVCDFLSSETLNPYYKQCSQIKNTVGEEEEDSCVYNILEEKVPVSSQAKDNNFNSLNNKVSAKIVPNDHHCEDPKLPLTPEANEVEITTSKSEECLLNISDSKIEVASLRSKEPQTVVDSEKQLVLDTRLNCSSEEFQPSQSCIPVILGRTNKQNHQPNSITRFCPPHPPVNYNYSQQPSGYNYTQTVINHSYSNYPVYSPPPIHLNNVLPWGYQGVPLQQQIPRWNQPSLQMNSNQWSGPVRPQTSEVQQKTWPLQDNSQLSDKKSDVNILNKNNISVNVNAMAPEFVPKLTNDSQGDVQVQTATSKINNYKAGETPILPPKGECFHVELRKPRSLITPGDNLVVMIAHVESPSEFYVHFINNNNKHLDKLLDDMFTYYTIRDKKCFSSWQEAKYSLGKFCACKWLEDNHWYRVEVINWNADNEKVRVYFVDYGNSEDVPLDCLQPLAKQFTKPSMCAQPCHLAKIHPLQKHEPWSEDSIDFFKSKVEVSNNRVYSVTVVPSQKNLSKINSLSVLLYEGKATENCLSINDVMVDSGMAWSKKLKHSQSVESGIYYSLDEIPQYNDITDANTENKLAKLHLPDPITEPMKSEMDDNWEVWDPQREDFESSRNNPAMNTDDPGVALIGYSAKDEARICKFYAQQGCCWKESCTMEHSIPDKDGLTTDKEETYSRAFNELDLPSVGEEISVKITAVSSISLFYVQLQEKRGSIDGEFKSDEDIETLTTLHNFMNRPQNVMEMKSLQAPPSLGQLVLAKEDFEDKEVIEDKEAIKKKEYIKNKEDKGQWFRARVISADESLEVMFVDYGTVSTVPGKNLRRMEPRYLHLPFQAIECSIANIITPDINSEEYDKGTELLRSVILPSVLKAKVYDSGDATDEMRRLQVLLQLKTGIDVGEWLVESSMCSLLPCMSWDDLM